jgi:lipid-A-disaccharide synthase
VSERGVAIVAGEASGDRIAALAARVILARGEPVFGIGGPACRVAGVEIVEGAERLAAMGVTDAVARLPALARALARLFDRARRSPPRAALLVNFTELNQRLGRLFRALGVRVLWCVAPQVWAWRPGRLHALRGAVDRLAVILPFEEALWRGAGVDARYVGHPSLDVPCPPRAELRARLGIDGEALAVAVLPGSRAGEIARLAAPLAEAAALLTADGTAHAARMILAPGLDPRARGLAEAIARREGVDPVDGDAEHGAAPLLGAFDAVLCASGTASLEAALAGAAPVVAYRLDPLSFAVARRLLRTPHIALPNVLLGRRAFPELVQGDVTPEAIASAARDLLARPADARSLADELRARLAPPSPLSFGERVAALLDPPFGEQPRP